jgi:hypothetical protein
MEHIGQNLETAYSVFGMVLITIGIGGGKRINVWKLEVGPITNEWRLISVLIGLLVWFGVGAMYYLKTMNS